MLENTCNVSKHSTKNSYQTIIITFPRFCFVLATKNKNEKNKNKRHEKKDGKDESMDEERRELPRADTGSRAVD